MNIEDLAIIKVTYPHSQEINVLAEWVCCDEKSAQQSVNAAFDSGVKLERDRIIKLLEENKWRDEVVFNLVIELIKGENK